MKKLLLLLFSLLISFNSYANVTYSPDGYGGYYGSDGTNWTTDSYGNLYGSDGTNCNQNSYGTITCYGGNLDNRGNSQQGWNNISKGMGGIGANLGKALGQIFSGYGQSNNQNNPIRSNITARDLWKRAQPTRKCKLGYFKDKTSKSCLKVPNNATKYFSAEAWFCNSGYVKSDNKCVSKITSNNSKKIVKKVTSSTKNGIPENARISGAGWECNKGYTQFGSNCIKK